MLPSPLVNLYLGSKDLKHNVFYGSILESPPAYFIGNLFKYILKIIFIHKNEGHIMFERSSMVLNGGFSGYSGARTFAEIRILKRVCN